jgi:hypothetical protein
LVLKFADEVRSDDPSAPQHLEAAIQGGSPRNIEMRWVETKNPESALSDKLVFEPNNSNAEPNQHRLYEFQVRRKGGQWLSHPVAVDTPLPPAYTQALAAGDKAFGSVESAPTSEAAMALLFQAQNQYDKAADIYVKGEGRIRSRKCADLLKQEGEYAQHHRESVRLSFEAEQQADLADKIGKLKDAKSEISLAKTIIKRAEADQEFQRLDQQIKELTVEYQKSELAAKQFDTLLADAHEEMRKAQKYENPSTALPHWETALETFKALAAANPKRIEVFASDMQKTQNEHDSAYLISQVGIVPARPDDHLYDIHPAKRPAVARPVDGAPINTSKVRETGRPNEP